MKPARLLPVAMLALAGGLLSIGLLGGCAVLPEGEREERDRAQAVQQELETEVPPLPEAPALEDYLRTAFHADPSLRRAFWEWRAAIERIPQEASPPDLALSFDYLFSDENMSSWDRTTLGLSNDPSSMIPGPGKLATAGRRALEEARAAGLRFEGSKFRLQAQVTSLFTDLALHAELIRLQEEQVGLLSLSANEAGAQLASGAGQEQLLRRQTALDLARSELQSLHAQMPLLAARMNMLTGRPAQAPVPLPAALPSPPALDAPDDEILARIAERSPELAALAHEVAGRQEALELARLAEFPDFGFSLSVTGSVESAVGGMLTLPVRREAIAGGIAEAEALLAALRAAREQHARGLAAAVVLDLVVLRNAERQSALFHNVIVPRAELLARNAEAGLASGQTALGGALELRLELIEARRTLAQLQAERVKALAAIESASDLDVDSLMHPRM
jgi:cobalt-zinc-cadmium efflux system outer membrane protein